MQFAGRWPSRASFLAEAAALQSQVAGLDKEADQAADLHSSICGPLQTELQSLKEKINDCMADRRPIAAADEARRREIFDEIHAANGELEKTIRRLDRTRNPLLREIRLLQTKAAEGAALEGQLSRDDLADPQLLLLKFSVGKASEYATARWRAAQAHVTQLRARIEEEGKHPVYIKRLEKWEFELNAATAAKTEADRLAEEAGRAVLDE